MQGFDMEMFADTEQWKLNNSKVICFLDYAFDGRGIFNFLSKYYEEKYIILKAQW